MGSFPSRRNALWKLSNLKLRKWRSDEMGYGVVSEMCQLLREMLKNEVKPLSTLGYLSRKASIETLSHLHFVVL